MQKKGDLFYMILQKVKWGDGSVSSCPKWLVDRIRQKQDSKLIVLGERVVSSGKLPEIEQEVSKDWLPIHANYQPIQFANTKHLNALENKDLWLKVRRRGIGGSESASARGFGKYQTMLSLYFDKTEDSRYLSMDISQNWEILEYGHLLEPWVRKVFQAKTGLKTMEVPIMYQHPLFPFMLADIDGIVIDRGRTQGFEAKTTNPHATGPWKHNSIPIHYVAQMQHYMAVMNFDVYYIACAYGNTRNDFFIRKIYRDFDQEERMICELERFWGYVQRREAPFQEQERCIEGLYQDYIHRKKIPRSITLPYNSNMIYIEKYAKLEEEKQRLAKEKQKNEQKLKKLKAIFLEQMEVDGGFLASNAVIHDPKRDCTYVLTIKQTETKKSLDAEAIEAFRLKDPELFSVYARETKPRISVSFKKYEENEIKHGNNFM